MLTFINKNFIRVNNLDLSLLLLFLSYYKLIKLKIRKLLLVLKNGIGVFTTYSLI